MLTTFLVMAILISAIDMIDLKKKGQAKDIYVFIGFIISAIGLGICYFTGIYKISIVHLIMQTFNIKG